ncbi:MAG: class I SAM-dependent methyltransferase [Chlamydiia bacterium]
MRDLLSLEYPPGHGCSLVGIDLDPESLALALELSVELAPSAAVVLRRADAWALEDVEAFSLITSSGLNVYEPDRAKVHELYKVFWRALRPGGVLVTSVLTYPPGCDQPSGWDLTAIDRSDLEFESLLFHDILEVKWKNFRSEADLRFEFEQAGFVEIEVHFDRARMFPTIVAYKPR